MAEAPFQATPFKEDSGQRPNHDIHRVIKAKSLSCEEGSHLRLIDFLYHSTLGWRVTKKRRTMTEAPRLYTALLRTSSSRRPNHDIFVY